MVTSDGTLLPDRAIDQTRLVPSGSPESNGATVTADGTALPDSDPAVAEDDSFGKQIILKSQPRLREFTLSADASLFYTSNVALTSRDAIADSFFVANIGGSWNHALSRTLQLQVGAHASLFRYNDTPALDFDSVGGGIGLTWTPRNPWGIAMFARYDFTQLLDRDGRDLLMDQEFSIGAQKIVVLGRSHALNFSLGGSAGVTDPFASQRDLLGGGVGYHVQLSRRFEMDLGYRWAVFFYNQGSRTDFNQLASLSAGYHVTPWATLSAFLSYGDNRSNRSVFDYTVFAGGGGLGFTVRF